VADLDGACQARRVWLRVLGPGAQAQPGECLASTGDEVALGASDGAKLLESLTLGDSALPT